MNLNSFYEWLEANYNTYKTEHSIEIIENDNKIIINLNDDTYSVDGGISYEHSRIFNLSNQENWSVLVFLLKLFKKGYSKNVITLEKCWQLGHDESGYLDIMLKSPTNNNIYMIEVKSKKEIMSYVNINKPKNLKQLLSYAMQERKTKLVSYYAFDFDENKDLFYNIYLDDILDLATNVDDLFDRWNKTFDRDDYIVKNDIFNIHPQILCYNDLININEETTKILYNQFITILRLNSVSDKPNAFNKMINLFLSKIVDEDQGDKPFEIKDKDNLIHSVKGLRFQYIQNLDTPQSFMKRLNELYKKGMEKYLNKEIIDYSDDEVKDILNTSNEEIWKMVDNLRLKKNNNFSFIEVYDDKTFIENFNIVKDIVKLFQNEKFKYDYKQQFLGDFFENLLNTSLKQEAGQFFTPYPLVDFIVQSIPFNEIINNKIEIGEKEWVPSVIDYACGAGHFLISAMEEIQNCINKINIDNLHSATLNKVKIYQNNPFEWVNRQNVVGIEKDYRLAKTTKIATFLNGDGEAEIISGDGINKFTADEYKSTILYTQKNILNYFDVLISNPPYSIKGFMYNFQKNNISPNGEVFSLLKKYNFNDSMIETYFVERAYQLLKVGGVAAIVLPQSILNIDKYESLRNFIFKNFKINAMLLTSDITFLGTTTSPVILFLTKMQCTSLDYGTMLIYSDKYYDIKTKKTEEEKFLGYKFSTNRSNSGTQELKISKLKRIKPILYQFLKNENKSNIPNELINNIVFTKLSNIIVKTSEGIQLFPKYIKNEGKTLEELNVKINPVTEHYNDDNIRYVEISSIKDQKIYPSIKHKTGRICKPGDILISSLVPSKDKIAIADNYYNVSKAIYILRTEDIKLRDKIFKELGEEYSLKQMHSLLEGFKLTYSKIKEEKLFKYIKLNIED